MQIKIVEATNVVAGGLNWGKFLVGRFDSEWQRNSEIAPLRVSLLHQTGWDQHHLLVLDLQTGEAAIFRPGGLASADLQKHRIWVCPLFEPFLQWLYKQNLCDITKLPDVVQIKDASSALHGYRRSESSDDLNRLLTIAAAARRVVDAQISDRDAAIAVLQEAIR